MKVVKGKPGGIGWVWFGHTMPVYKGNLCLTLCTRGGLKTYLGSYESASFMMGRELDGCGGIEQSVLTELETLFLFYCRRPNLGRNQAADCKSALIKCESMQEQHALWKAG